VVVCWLLAAAKAVVQVLSITAVMLVKVLVAAIIVMVVVQ
jgi:hypothetical protein